MDSTTKRAKYSFSAGDPSFDTNAVIRQFDNHVGVFDMRYRTKVGVKLCLDRPQATPDVIPPNKAIPKTDAVNFDSSQNLTQTSQFPKVFEENVVYSEAKSFQPSFIPCPLSAFDEAREEAEVEWGSRKRQNLFARLLLSDVVRQQLLDAGTVVDMERPNEPEALKAFKKDCLCWKRMLNACASYLPPGEGTEAGSDLGAKWGTAFIGKIFQILSRCSSVNDLRNSSDSFVLTPEGCEVKDEPVALQVRYKILSDFKDIELFDLSDFQHTITDLPRALRTTAGKAWEESNVVSYSMLNILDIAGACPMYSVFLRAAPIFDPISKTVLGYDLVRVWQTAITFLPFIRPRETVFESTACCLPPSEIGLVRELGYMLGMFHHIIQETTPTLSDKSVSREFVSRTYGSFPGVSLVSSIPSSVSVCSDTEGEMSDFSTIMSKLKKYTRIPFLGLHKKVTIVLYGQGVADVLLKNVTRPTTRVYLDQHYNCISGVSIVKVYESKGAYQRLQIECDVIYEAQAKLWEHILHEHREYVIIRHLRGAVQFSPGCIMLDEIQSSRYTNMAAYLRYQFLKQLSDLCEELANKYRFFMVDTKPSNLGFYCRGGSDPILKIIDCDSFVRIPEDFSVVVDCNSLYTKGFSAVKTEHRPVNYSEQSEVQGFANMLAYMVKGTAYHDSYKDLIAKCRIVEVTERPHFADFVHQLRSIFPTLPVVASVKCLYLKTKK